MLTETRTLLKARGTGCGEAVAAIRARFDIPGRAAYYWPHRPDPGARPTNTAMLPARPACTLLALAIGAPPGAALAFRDCGVEDSGAWSALSRYVVGELGYDNDTGATSGTETHYNYSNLPPRGVVECHVTYELDGVFEAYNGAFMLEARRSNLSASCDPDFVAAEYPESMSYYLEVAVGEDGIAEMRRSDTGELYATGDWRSSGLAYKTDEQCSLM